MWDPIADFDEDGKDFPCNMSICFRIRDNRLDMTVFNRSNDIIWGAYGANAVHMSMMQEYVASLLRIHVGRYNQVSNNFHAYVDILDKIGKPQPHPLDLYDMNTVNTMPMVKEPRCWDTELQHWMKDWKQARIYNNPIFPTVATPMAWAYQYFKGKNYPKALEMVKRIHAPDWRRSCKEWLTRRAEKHATENDKKRRSGSKVAHDPTFD